MKRANAEAFSTTFAQILLEFRHSVERHDRHSANASYATAMGLIAGAILSGGLEKTKGLELLATLKETRTVFSRTFGDAPSIPDISIN